MSILAPLGLIALLLLPVICLLHLRHARFRSLTLSSTLLWSRLLADAPQMRPRRLPVHLLLLALQLAAVACGVLALARPALDAAGWRSNMVVAVDTSLAMSATDIQPTRLARARAVMGGMIDNLAPWDTMTIVDMGASPRVLATSSDHTTLRQALGGLTPGVGPSSLAADGPLLAGLQAASGAHTHVLVLAPLGAPPAALNLLRQSVPALQVQTVGVDSSDRGVAGLTIACPQGGATGSCEAFARLINTGTRSLTTRVTAVVDGAPSTRTITLPAQSSTPLRLSLPARAHLLQVQLDGHDALPADDTAWAAVPTPVQHTVLLLSSTPASTVAQALRAIPYLHVQVLAPSSPGVAAQARRADLTVVEGASTGDIPGNLLVIHPARGSMLSGTITTARAPTLTTINTSSPLLRGVDLSSLVLYTASTARPPAWAHSDIGSSAGPLLFDGTTNGRRVAILLIDPQIHTGAHGGRTGSNLSTLLAFPTLLQNAVEALNPPPPVDLPAGQIAAEPVRAGAATWLYWTSGHPIALPTADTIAAIPALPPGSYALSGGATGPVTANAPVPADPFTQQPLPTGTTTSSSLLMPLTAAPWEIWPLVIVLALLLLVVEWWYYTCRT
jgi:hypothetical protein